MFYYVLKYGLPAVNGQGVELLEQLKLICVSVSISGIKNV